MSFSSVRDSQTVLNVKLCLIGIMLSITKTEKYTIHIRAEHSGQDWTNLSMSAAVNYYHSFNNTLYNTASLERGGAVPVRSHGINTTDTLQMVIHRSTQANSLPNIIQFAKQSLYQILIFSRQINDQANRVTTHLFSSPLAALQTGWQSFSQREMFEALASPPE